MNLGVPSDEVRFLVQKCVRRGDRAIKRRIARGRNQVFNGVVGEGDAARQIRPTANGLRRDEFAGEVVNGNTVQGGANSLAMPCVAPRVGDYGHVCFSDRVRDQG